MYLTTPVLIIFLKEINTALSIITESCVCAAIQLCAECCLILWKCDLIYHVEINALYKGVSVSMAE